MKPTVIAGAYYFAIVFVAAFAFGVVRTLVLEPAFGETIAVACEIPLLIVVMYVAARWVIAHINVPRTVPARLGMGVIALVLQQIAELGLVFASGETLAMHGAYLQTTAGLLYLAALAVFLVLPCLLLWTRRI